ncbi:MAG: hypothetical protein EP298_12150 [Gammaproteobacteria bacterium]|nr:MAG: hypothetical protein EP298_12150 [Gammaproteobacteria bacterium]UTW43046.1 hypothetical protein KFE69_02575 [bacterium SCSIO 12844]
MGKKYFRLVKDKEMIWNGKNIDATPKGFGIWEVPRPRPIKVVTADEKTTSAYINIDYDKNFKLLLKQNSRIETGVQLVADLMQIPGMTANGGAKKVATEIAGLIQKLISKVDIALIGTMTTTLYRTSEDGDELAHIRSSADTEVTGEVDPSHFGGVKFTIKTDVSSPGGAGEAAESKRVKSYNKPGNINDRVSDYVYIKLPAEGKVPVTLTTTLEGSLEPVVEQKKVNELIDNIIKQLRSVGALEKVGTEEKVKSPKRASGESDATFSVKIAQFGAQLLTAFKAVLNAILDSVKSRIVGALVKQTNWQFTLAEEVPEHIKREFKLAMDPTPLKKGTTKVAKSTKKSTTTKSKATVSKKAVASKK